eukprot:8322900-Pyramimonas_sp.AAC.1
MFLWGGCSNILKLFLGEGGWPRSWFPSVLEDRGRASVEQPPPPSSIYAPCVLGAAKRLSRLTIEAGVARRMLMPKHIV